MTHPLLLRAHLEALLIARAVVTPSLAGELLTTVDRDRVSVAAWKLLEQLADPAVELLHARTDAQLRLAARVDAITIADLTFWPFDILLKLVNQLPERTTAPAAWERDLERGCNAA